MRERYTDRPLAGTVEATTTFGDGSVAFREQDFRDGSFEIDVPSSGETDLIIQNVLARPAQCLSENHYFHEGHID